MNPWTLLVPAIASRLEGHLARHGGRTTSCSSCCSARSSTSSSSSSSCSAAPSGATFTSDPSQVTAVIACRNGADVLPGTIAELRARSCRRPHPGGGRRQHRRHRRMSRARWAARCSASSAPRARRPRSTYAIHRVRTPLTLLLDDDTRLGGARMPTSLHRSRRRATRSRSTCCPTAAIAMARAATTSSAHLQRYEYGKSMEIGKRFHDVDAVGELRLGRGRACSAPPT